MKRLTVLAVVLLIAACDSVADPIPTMPAPIPWAGPSDWPGALRVEPAGGAATASIDRTFTDGIGDIGEGRPGWLDITSMTVVYKDLGFVAVTFELADDLPLPIPGRVAYGLVADVDGDGTADVQFGIVNISDVEHLVWRTDLATGMTEHGEGPPRGGVADTLYPSQPERSLEGKFLIEPLPGEFAEFRLYLWASQMQGAQVVATDYAPDEGWIGRPIGP